MVSKLASLWCGFFFCFFDGSANDAALSVVVSYAIKVYVRIPRFRSCNIL